MRIENGTTTETHPQIVEWVAHEMNFIFSFRFFLQYIWRDFALCTSFSLCCNTNYAQMLPWIENDRATTYEEGKYFYENWATDEQLNRKYESMN